MRLLTTTGALLLVSGLLCLSFADVLRWDLGDYYRKDLYGTDESTNSVVSANLARKAWPPLLRLNPLNENFASWLDGPEWQHIPPLFAYVPVPLFKLEGRITVETKRVSYAALVLLTGLGFVAAVAAHERRWRPIAAAAVATVLFYTSLFTRNLIRGTDFGASDLMLAATVVLAYAALLWLSRALRPLPLWKLALAGVAAALPICAKQALGGIAPATLLLFALREDGYRPRRAFLTLSAALGLTVLAEYLPMYLASPIAFQIEQLWAFRHISNNVDTWERPWHYFISEGYPDRYFKDSWALVVAGLCGALAWFLRRGPLDRAPGSVAVAGVWAGINLLVVSLLKSKSPNFVFQSYLLALYFISYGVLSLIIDSPRLSPHLARSRAAALGAGPRVRLAATLAVLTGGVLAWQGALGTFSRVPKGIRAMRGKPYVINTLNESYYEAAEELEKRGAGLNDLVVVDGTKEDDFFRYYILFLTGAEGVSLTDARAARPTAAEVARKYLRLHFVRPRESPLPPSLLALGEVSALGRYREVRVPTSRLTDAALRAALE